MSKETQTVVKKRKRTPLNNDLGPLKKKPIITEVEKKTSNQKKQKLEKNDKSIITPKKNEEKKEEKKGEKNKIENTKEKKEEKNNIENIKEKNEKKDENKTNENKNEEPIEEIGKKEEVEIKTFENFHILLKNKFICSWIEEESLKLLNTINSKEKLEDFLERNDIKSFIGIKSNFKKGTTEVAKFPNEILRFFGNISVLNTKGNRKTMISLLKQFDFTLVKNFEINGKIYSENKKIFPLQLENIKKAKFNIFSISNFLDPDIVNLNIEQLYIRNVKFQKKIENIFNGGLKSVGFMFCDFIPGYEFLEMFSETSLEKLESMSFHSTNFPVLNEESMNVFKKLKTLILYNLEKVPEKDLEKVFNLSCCIEKIKIINLTLNDFTKIMGILKNQTNLKQIHLSKIHSKWKI